MFLICLFLDILPMLIRCTTLVSYLSVFRYTADVDKMMTVLKIVDADGNPFGMLW